MSAPSLGWLGIVRLGLVQTALGAIVVLTTSTLNRVMVVELALPAVLPGALVAWHYALQVLRPRWGFGADAGRRSTPIIIGGMATLALGGALSAVATTLLSVDRVSGTALAVLAFSLIGLGVGAAGTSLLVLLAKRVAPDRRVAAATIVWLMMIAGFAITAGTAGHFLDPFSLPRLISVTSTVSVLALILATVAVWGIEGDGVAAEEKPRGSRPTFRAALAEVWAEPQARLFTIFIFVSMLAYSAQDLILEPFAGAIFGFSPGQSTKLSGLQNGGVFTGMVLVALVAGRFGTPQGWTVAGCLASAAALLALAFGGQVGAGWPISPTVFALGVANGIYAASAIGSMMALAGAGRSEREGTRMGVWGASQAIAFGIGGTLGTISVDLARHAFGSALFAYCSVFVVEALLFLVAAIMATRVATGRVPARALTSPSAEFVAMASGRG